MQRRIFMQSTAALGAAAILPLQVFAQGDRRKEMLIVANETGPNSLDIQTVGANRPSYGVSWLCYDRLVTYGRKTLPDGTVMYDYTKLEPELAESWAMAPDGMSVTFKLRKDAKFHDGTPITAKDVKWSFDRAVTVGGFPTFQMKAGSLEKPEQFIVVDDHTFRVDFLRKDKLTMNDLGVPVASIFNSELVKKNATAEDPWGLAWTKTNIAGGGAYKVESWKPGQEIIYSRYDGWKSGPLPKIKRVVQREVPSAGNRRALLEKGDIDMTFEMPPKDFAEMSQEKGNVRVISTPVENALWYVGMNVTKPPFDNPKVRQAVAYAIPYERIMDSALYKRATPMWGGSNTPKTADWPQPTGYKYDVPKARALLKEAGYENGFETTISFDLGSGTVSEPACVLIAESLGLIGIKCSINKVPGANWRAALLKKDMPLILNRFGGWLNYPEYFFFWCYHSQNAVFNTMSYQNTEMDKYIEAARFDTDKKKYEADVKKFLEIAWTDVPRIPIAQPSLDVAMQKSIKGYQYWFHLQPDYRQIYKS
ncbi:MAG TPA: ABC transporter substrate-binding protein [Burkholderiales bacterium]|jgi:peptide/nickel transport system substrate-binding protein|nr:ABC transporter substrate-binding protein [Burkholderiales bacterium]